MFRSKKNAPIRTDSSQTQAFAALRDALPVVSSAAAPKAVVIGGGTGAPVSIRTLLSLGIETSAVVAMADDGGSTGILRKEAGATPPGDVRKCLAAFAADPDDPMAKAFKYRFEFANDHTLGNLLLTALEYATDSFPEAIKICENLLHARGEVHPSTLDKITLSGRTLEGKVISGQSRLSHSRCALESVWLNEDRPATPYPAAIKAICEADLIVLGPGSLFTSIIPNLLVPGVIDAIKASRGKVLFVCGLADMQGETLGMTAEDHVNALYRHGMAGLIDFVLIHSVGGLYPLPRVAVEDPYETGFAGQAGIRPVKVDYESALRIDQSGARVMVKDLVDHDKPTWHDPEALREAFTEVLRFCPSPLK